MKNFIETSVVSENVTASLNQRERESVCGCRTKCWIESAIVSYVGSTINHIQINKLICAKWHGATSNTIYWYCVSQEWVGGFCGRFLVYRSKWRMQWCVCIFANVTFQFFYWFIVQVCCTANCGECIHKSASNYNNNDSTTWRWLRIFTIKYSLVTFHIEHVKHMKHARVCVSEECREHFNYTFIC